MTASLPRMTSIPGRAAMFEDIARNLEAPHELGMTTVLVHDKANEDGNKINSTTR